MKRKLLFILSLILLTGFSGYAKLYINEVNSTGKWIEIYNSGENTVNVEGYFVVRNNNDGTSRVATLPAKTTIAPKGFLVLFQGSAVYPPIEGAIDCMDFGISTDKFMSAVLKNSQGNPVDDFDIGNPQTVTVSSGKSWARETDGAETIVALEPTPGKPNNSSQTYSNLNIYINEVNSTGKWIEIYNDEANPINLGGYTITRYNNDGAAGIATLPANVVIASKGFLVIYEGPANNGTSPSPVAGAIDCMPYGISSDKFMRATLRDKQWNIVDETFNIGDPQTVTVIGGKSWMSPSFPTAVIEETATTKIIMNSDGLLAEIPKDQHDTIPHFIKSSIVEGRCCFFNICIITARRSSFISSDVEETKI